MPSPATDSRWTPLRPDLDAGGSLTVFYADPLARVPVRGVTRPGDNKADPNIETLTYGLFSTCGQRMRSGIVRDRRGLLFFTATWGGQRVLAGYYRLAWYGHVTSLTRRDFALAAAAGRFDSEPLSLADIDARLGTSFARPFRGALTLSPAEATRLADLLESRPDGTDRYLDEIDRLERFNLYHGQSRYLGWDRQHPFAWDDADAILADGPPTQTEAVSNTSPTGRWACTACRYEFENRSRLRLCPHCSAAGALAPALEST